MSENKRKERERERDREGREWKRDSFLAYKRTNLSTTHPYKTNSFETLTRTLSIHYFKHKSLAMETIKNAANAVGDKVNVCISI